MPPADLAILGAAVRTLDPARPHATAVAVRDGLIVAVGDDAEVREHTGPRTELIDGRGMAVVPGLADSHIHPFHGSDGTRGADLNGLRTLDEVRGALAAERARCGPGEWLLGWGLSYDAFHGRRIGADAIADVTGDAPTFLTFFDYHSGLASRSALALAGVDGPREFAAGAAVVCDDGGVPTGELREAPAMAVVEAQVPALSDAQRLDACAATLRRLNAMGLTGVHEMLGSPRLYDDVEALEARGDLTVRAIVPLLMEPDVTDAEVDALLEHSGRRGRRWRGGVAKFFIDGVIDSGTGWLFEPGPQGGGTEPFWPDPDRYAAVVARCARAGLQCATHAIGDRAVAAALDAYRDAGPPRVSPPGRTPAREPGPLGRRSPHRIEHLETMRDEELARLAREGVAASMQPLHAEGLDEPGPMNWRDNLQPEQVAHGFRWGDVRRSGAILSLGSDWPVVSADPRIGLAWARLRRAPGRPERTPFTPDQVLSPFEALEGYTTEAARVVGEAHLGGRIAPGLRADLTGLGADPVDCPADDLPDVPVRLTVVDGAVVYRG
jgi:predicted amidohydrolase YtcJ